MLVRTQQCNKTKMVYDFKQNNSIRRNKRINCDDKLIMFAQSKIRS